jgi:hypothetical protein
MRRTFKLLPYMLGMALITMIVSCGKEGPAGPAGAAGPAGPAGASGPAGPAGATGTANVMYSDWLKPTWLIDTIIVSSTRRDTLWYVDITAPKLDTNILNKGEIKTYVNLSSNPSFPVVYPLPFNNGAVYIDPVYAPSIIELSSNYNLTGLPVRYVLIPGGTHARIGTTIDWNDYNQVKTYLGLKD